jgi:two-component system, sensor histidine kinase PdtaS
VATPTELTRLTELSPGELDHLQRLLGSWAMLADLSFSDLVLMVPAAPHPETPEPIGDLVVFGQMRPNNRPTLVEQDLVGSIVSQADWGLPIAKLDTGEIVRTEVALPGLGREGAVEHIPVRLGGKVIAILIRLTLAPNRNSISLYERTYLDVFDRLASMVAWEQFPFPEEDVGTEELPRVGDGFVVVDAEGRVEFASPNAVNAFHRMGVYADPEGRRFADLGVEETAAEWALATGRPVVEEVERRPNVVVLVHCIPLISHGSITGAMILLRDVTDVRRLDRLLLSKDAAIREVHHRVKNNLQTISSLLSLQARRVAVGEGREALLEAERRVRSIALVHEILSRDPGDQVPFDDIVTSIVQMAEDSVVSITPVEITVTGELGEVAADTATPLAVALAELLQNAVEHAFVDPGVSDGQHRQRGHVAVTLGRSGGSLVLEVRDDGRGVPEGFDLDTNTSLGLSIVRDLVESQLTGTISMHAPPDGMGTSVVIAVPAKAGS